ncbi:hypothetical protein A9R10_13055 [Aeromonas piscicola]|nr:hypothetical protein A9R10_13055 [Aeromonas piscicola]
MAKRELFEVMVSQASGVSGQALKSMQDQSKMDQTYAVAAEPGNSKLYLADQPGIGFRARMHGTSARTPAPIMAAEFSP